jgi:hypothetical protein
VIALLNREFVPVLHDPSNPATKGVAPALSLWERTYASNWGYREGFATTVVVSADAKIPLATSGIAKHHWRDVGHSANHLPEKCVALLEDALDRHGRYETIRKSPPGDEGAREALDALQTEIIRSIRDVSRGNDGRTVTLQ